MPPKGIPQMQEVSSFMPRSVSVAVLALSLLAFPRLLLAQDDPPPKAQPAVVALSAAILKRLPPDYGERASSLLTATEENQQRWQKLSDEDLTAAVIGQLARKPEATDFLLAELEKETSA